MESNLEKIEIQTEDKPMSEKKTNCRFFSFLATAIIIIAGIVIVFLFRKQVNAFGIEMMTRYGQGPVDFILFIITAVSCTPLFLPVWGYAVAGVAMGYNIYRLTLVMTLGSTVGSWVTFILGKYFSNNNWVKSRFGDLLTHKWTHGKSKLYVTLILLLGTASPIPCDVFYAACGAKHYPTWLFFLSVGAGRFIRYFYIAYGYLYFQDTFAGMI
ncbi:MAG: VTT domain-containing protein [Candidatus Zixiibacteriota bacterium]